MGKRQLGEMQPFELVITLIIAEVACIPLNDPSIPLHTGALPTLCLAVIHILFSFMARHSLLWRKTMSGEPVLAIDRGSINYRNLVKMNMNASDLLEAISCGGTQDIMNIKYAIFETNGQLSIVKKPEQQSSNKQQELLLPVSLVIDGKLIKKTLDEVGITEMQLQSVLKKNGVTNIKTIALADIRQNGDLYVSPKNKPSFIDKLSVKNQW